MQGNVYFISMHTNGLQTLRALISLHLGSSVQYMPCPDNMGGNPEEGNPHNKTETISLSAVNFFPVGNKNPKQAGQH